MKNNCVTGAIYFDMFAGCSGDMILGALLDAGLTLEQLAGGLATLRLEGYRITQTRVKRGAISAISASVMLDDHGHGHGHDRSYSDIVALISSSGLSDKVKAQATDVFRNLGKAEAKVHGVTLEEVHFHEVGAIDSIVDIVGALVGFECLGITQFFASPFPVTSGSVTCRHGELPLPAPATLELLAGSKAPVERPSCKGMEGKELVTPTGAAIITTLAAFQKPSLVIRKIGYGAGSRNDDEYPNVLRIWIGEMAAEKHAVMVMLETNIDDMNPQFYDSVMENLFKQGALDVWLTPIQMKKNRPAVMLSVLAPVDLEDTMAETLMRETTTLGIRVRPVDRHIAGRETLQINSSVGPVHVKIKRFKDEVLSVSPEYDECRIVAAAKGIPVKEIYRIIEGEARKFLAP
jgi:pyridinium-3,5-bisthiocarboxylic acid mononucleotide nickel chelatase